MNPNELSTGFEIGGHTVAPGTREDIELPVERLASGPWISLPIVVLHGRRSGPVVWVSAAVHGDEINGVETIRRLLGELRAAELAGSLIVVPVVNMLGFMAGDRHLPDRRDLNRAFPGSERGSLAARTARLFMGEIVERCDYGIDLHTAADQRMNLPQIRANLRHPETRACAVAFSAPLMMHADSRDGSLRQAATAAGKTVLLFEGGGSGRYDDDAVTTAYEGILRVLARLEMNPPSAPATSRQSYVATRSRWVRASRGGLLRLEVGLGDRVEHGQVLGHLSDIFGRQNRAVRASEAGLVIGLNQTPLVNQGDALFHIASIENGEAELDAIAASETLDSQPPTEERR